jgi:hypothetical protein
MTNNETALEGTERAEPAIHRLELGSGNYAVLQGGLIRLHLADDRELFSVDAGTFSFDRQILAGVIQVYLIGYNKGRSTERERLKGKNLLIHKLTFEE